jgi:hypothetical protein
MKVGGKASIVRNSKAITLKSGEDSITLTLTAVPLGWRERVQKIKAFALPEPPREPIKGANGKIQRGEDGLAIVATKDNDPDYLAKLAEIGGRLRALKVFETLRFDPNVSFESKEPTTEDDAEWAAFCDSLISEFRSFGLTGEELAFIDEVGNTLSSRIDMEELRKSFLPDQAE